MTVRDERTGAVPEDARNAAIAFEPEERLSADGPSLDETAIADDFDAGTDAPLGRAGVDRALAND